MGRPELLRRAIENVMRNAARFTPEGAAVECRVGRAGQTVEIAVRDHGPGVPAEHVAEIFRPFFRVESARDRETGGAGLGLAIVERAVHLHGGTVAAENAEGGGLRVVMRFPVA
jgi:two-component system sensor histidine kinase CpxA